MCACWSLPLCNTYERLSTTQIVPRLRAYACRICRRIIIRERITLVHAHAAFSPMACLPQRLLLPGWKLAVPLLAFNVQEEDVLLHAHVCTIRCCLGGFAKHYSTCTHAFLLYLCVHFICASITMVYIATLHVALILDKEMRCCASALDCFCA